jgi:hypothetical protein
MEADWEIEIGGDAPVIDGCWDGLVDLRRFPERAAALAESRQLPGLAEALVQLNSVISPVWTSKCDVWSPEEFAPYEMEATEEEGKWAIACYIDLLPRTDQEWKPLQAAVDACKSYCLHFHEAPLRCCRADLVVRRAWSASLEEDVGITAYLTASGRSLDQARTVLMMALGVLVDAVVNQARCGSGG